MLKILGRKTSSNVQKVLWACDELGLDYDREDIGGSFGMNREAAYLALNPNGLVPTLIDDGFVLWESHAIVRYLGQKHAPNALYPTELQQVALANQWMDWCHTTVNPAIRAMFWGLVRTPPEERNLDAIARSRDDTEVAMGMLNKHLSAAAFVAGDDFSMGDIPLGVMAYRWFEMDIERREFPHLARWYQRLMERSSFAEHVMIGLGPA
ncbi:MAG: glutathione S-transferase family protein [Gammaproteobacteria bacterium]|nr:glutathione S-transferase family protein [Gammaproteobacteria bacterium]